MMSFVSCGLVNTVLLTGDIVIIATSLEDKTQLITRLVYRWQKVGAYGLLINTTTAEDTTIYY